MQLFTTILFAVQILSALVMIGLILVQHGKGADMGAAFGSGTSGSLFGASGSANFLSRLTAVLATVFFVSTLGLAYTSGVRPTGSGSGSVLDKAPISAPASSPSSALPASGAQAIPTAPAAPAAQTAPAAAVPAPSSVPAPSAPAAVPATPTPAK